MVRKPKAAPWTIRGREWNRHLEPRNSGSEFRRGVRCEIVPVIFPHRVQPCFGFANAIGYDD